MSAWKALYVLPLVGISLAATAETKVDYQYEGQQPEAVVDTPIGKDSKKSFKEKNMQEGHFIIDEEAGSITMVYFDHNGNEMRAQYKEMPLRSGDYYFHNGNMCTPGVLEQCSKEEDAVLLSAYRSNGSKVRGVVTPNNNYATGVWDTSKPFEEQETVYHMDGEQYNARGGKYVEIEETQQNKEQKSITVRGRDENGKDVEVSSSDLVIVVNEERMPAGYDLNTIAPETITSMEVLKTEDALKEYGTENGVIKITVDPSKKGQKKPVPDIYINGKKATSEEVAALPPNPKGHIAEDGTMHIYTDQGANEKALPLEVNN